MHVCDSHGYGGLDGEGMELVFVGMRGKARGLVACRMMPEYISSAR